MVFWILVAGLVAGVTLVVTRPLMRSEPQSAPAGEADMAVYKDQLKEVAADEARGSLAAGEAEGARLEIARRLLRSSQIVEKPPAPGRDNQRFASTVSVVMSIALPVASLALYFIYGAPGLPGQPLKERLAEAVNADRPNDLVAKVEARLRERPDDGVGWDVISPVYYAMGRYADAAGAYANALRLLGETPTRLQGFANARIRTENGIIPEDARKALERILVLAPNVKEPQIWLALAKEQDGRLAEAAADYQRLIADAPADAPWRKLLEQRLAGLSPGSPPSARPNGGAPASEPTASAGNDASGIAATPDAAVMAMSPEERQAFIARMVDGLAARLQADGSDASGWLKLIRAYQVLGRRDDAVKALSDARIKLKGDEVGLARVEDLARQLGLGS